MLKIAKMLRNRKGFTLVELMVVVVIIGILSAIAVPLYSNSQTRAQNAADDANIRILNGAVTNYVASEVGKSYADFNGISIVRSATGTATVTGTWPTGFIGTYIQAAPVPSRTDVTYTYTTNAFHK